MTESGCLTKTDSNILVSWLNARFRFPSRSFWDWSLVVSPVPVWVWNFIRQRLA